MFKKMIWVITLALALILAACQGAKNEPNIIIEKAWGPASPPTAESGAFYMVIRNTGPADRLVSVQSEACGMAQIHQSTMSENGVMSMHQMNQGLVIPAKSQVELKPGGMHIMCMEKKVDFKGGNKITLTLIFEKNGPRTIEAEIREP